MFIEIYAKKQRSGGDFEEHHHDYTVNIVNITYFNPENCCIYTTVGAFEITGRDVEGFNKQLLAAKGTAKL